MTLYRTSIRWLAPVMGIGVLGWVACSKTIPTPASQPGSTQSGLAEEERGELGFSVDSEAGARVVTFSLDGHNVLVEKQGDNIYGSTYWTSPQGDWGWPPISELNSGPYETTGELSYSLDAVAIDNESTGKNPRYDPAPSVRVTKTFSVDQANQSVDVVYSLEYAPPPETAGAEDAQPSADEGEPSPEPKPDGPAQAKREPITLASWEVTRVLEGGLTFFEPGPGDIDLDPTKSEGKETDADWGATGETDRFEPFSGYELKDGVVWYDHKASTHQRHIKMIAPEGSRWLAHVIRGNPNLIFIKVMTAPSRIHVYANHRQVEPQYVEIENEGPLEELRAGRPSEYKVRWLLRKLPKQYPVEPCFDLVSYVRNIVEHGGRDM